MAKIREYIAPIDRLRTEEKTYAAFETAGRRIGPLFNQAGQDQARAGMLAAQSILNQARIQALAARTAGGSGAGGGGSGAGGGGGGGGRRGGRSPGPSEAADAAAQLARTARRLSARNDRDIPDLPRMHYYDAIENMVIDRPQRITFGAPGLDAPLVGDPLGEHFPLTYGNEISQEAYDLAARGADRSDPYAYENPSSIDTATREFGNAISQGFSSLVDWLTTFNGTAGTTADDQPAYYEYGTQY